MMKIVAVVGDHYHEEDLYKKTLEKVIEDSEEISVLYTTRDELLGVLEDKPEMVILASENRLDPENNKNNTWLNESGAEKISSYVKEGGAWLSWHSGLAGYKDTPTYTNMIGGYFTHHPAQHAEVSYHYKDHSFVSERLPKIEVIDEHYFININHENDLAVFLESTSRDGHSIAGWTKMFGEGRVSAFTPAHTEKGLENVAVQGYLRRLIEWSLT